MDQRARGPAEQGRYVTTPEQLAARAQQTPATPAARRPQPAPPPAPMSFSEQARRGIPTPTPDQFAQPDEMAGFVPPARQPNFDAVDHILQPPGAGEASGRAMAAALGKPPVREKVVALDMPITDGAGRVWNEVVLTRPKWSLLESYLGHDLVTSKQLTPNSAIIAACARVPLDFMLELDAFDGMRLMSEANDFFPQDLQDKLRGATPSS